MSRRDLDFLLYEWLDVVELTKHEHFAEHSRDTFDAVLDLSSDIATKRFAPHNKKADHNPPFVDENGRLNLRPDLYGFDQAGIVRFPDKGLPPESLLWATPEGNLMAEDPRQAKLPLRQVEAEPARELKTVAG